MARKKVAAALPLALTAVGVALAVMAASVAGTVFAQSGPPGYYTQGFDCQLDGSQAPCPGTPGLGAECGNPADPNAPNFLIAYCSKDKIPTAPPPKSCQACDYAACHANAAAGQCPTERSCLDNQPTSDPPKDCVETIKSCNAISTEPAG